MAEKNLALGILGGTFDPIHLAHLKLAEYALTELELDKVIFMPAFIPPHKLHQNITDEKHRLKMTELAVAGNPRFTVSDLELHMNGASYTARTLSILKEQQERLVFIVGADSYMALDTWYHPEIIMEKAEIACACRDDISYNTLLERSVQYKDRYNAITHILRMPDTEISSSHIRELIAAGMDASEFLPKAVYDYIQKNKLYI